MSATDEQPTTTAFGPNAWLVDEMHERYLADPQSVGESWREFFADYKNDLKPNAPTTPAASPPPAPAKPAPPPPPSPQVVPHSTDAEPLRGAAARIVSNMEASLAVPTATSFREVPAKLLEVNRRIINGYLGRTRGGKVSFTHIIAHAIVKAFETVPAMKASYALAESKPGVVRHEHVGLGIAVDQEKSDGTRTLLVPVIKEADTLTFSELYAAYEELIRKVRANKISPEDFAGGTATLTNPGTVGTVQSVPRLMPGQGVIVGVGALDYPAAYQAADPQTLAEMGISKVMTITSTYDHRIIQGAESGLFLKRIHELLLGADDFYVEIFRSLGVPYEPAEWKRDSNPNNSADANIAKHLAVNRLINLHRVRGHLIADLDPLKVKEPDTHPELDPLTHGLTIWDLDREFYVGDLAGHERMALGDILGLLRDAYCRTIGVEYMHIQEADQKRWIQEHVEGVRSTVDALEQRHILGRLNAAEAFEKFLATKYVGAKRFGIEGAESAIPLLDAILDSAADSQLESAVVGMAHRGRLNVLANIIGKSLPQIFGEFEGHVDPDMVQGSGDVKYHLGAKGTFRSRAGNLLPIELAANPSHLEAVDPVVEGMVRAMQDGINRPGTYTILPLLIHGDAAFA
ncbi:MAG TPA: 2-oxo acid dehydrogenase subunit E2, partial [Acidimicrobiales bacterium]|nr:2-oxo acid dehydrogenase subunit E2 [Acidimicrobiales bacterium]